MRVHLLFLDESGQLSERKFFALGGVALCDADWRTLHDLRQGTLAENRWPPEKEVKRHGIARGKCRRRSLTPSFRRSPGRRSPAT
ncbi:MAG: hypothetical protein ACRDPZ_14030 [Gaiellaceae bacterium]